MTKDAVGDDLQPSSSEKSTEYTYPVGFDVLRDNVKDYLNEWQRQSKGINSFDEKPTNTFNLRRQASEQGFAFAAAIVHHLDFESPSLPMVLPQQSVAQPIEVQTGRQDELILGELGTIKVKRLPGDRSKLTAREPNLFDDGFRDEARDKNSDAFSVAVQKRETQYPARCEAHREIVKGLCVQLARDGILPMTEPDVPTVESGAAPDALTLPTNVGNGQDSGHFAYSPEKRRQIVIEYHAARDRGEIENKDTWARQKYGISGKVLLSYERQNRNV